MVGQFISDSLKTLKPFSDFSLALTNVRSTLFELYFACGSDLEFFSSANVYLHLAYLKTSNESCDFRFEISEARDNLKVFFAKEDMFNTEPLLNLHCPERLLEREIDRTKAHMLLARHASCHCVVFTQGDIPILVMTGTKERSAVQSAITYAARTNISLEGTIASSLLVW